VNPPCLPPAIAAILIVLTGPPVVAQQAALDYQLKLEVILPEAQGKGSWFQPRPAAALPRVLKNNRLFMGISSPVCRIGPRFPRHVRPVLAGIPSAATAGLQK